MIGKILISGVVGTSAMTLFSYIVSDWKSKNFNKQTLFKIAWEYLNPR